MKILFTLISIFIGYLAVAQTPAKSFVVAQVFSKDEAVYEAKSYIASQVLGNSPSYLKFEIDALAATTGGELTTLFYNCTEKKEEGLVLCFYGNYFNETGQVYQGYAFKHLTSEKAKNFILKLNNCIAENEKYLYADKINNNVYFNFEDITILAYVADATKFRIFWNGFDADWDLTSFKKTQKRFVSKVE